MASSSTPDRIARLRQMSDEFGINGQPLLSPLPRPEHPPSFRTDHDVLIAEELLKSQRVMESQQQSKGSLARAFTSTKKKTYEYKEVYGALLAHLNNKGSPGVAEALVAKLNSLGGNLNLAQKSRTSLLSRRKSLDLSERSQILHVAVRNHQLEMVQVLLPYADALVHTALPISLRNGTTAITKLLIQYGACASQTAAGLDAFRQACAAGGQSEIIAMVWLSQSLIAAIRSGCLGTVENLSQSPADCDFDRAAALKTAIDLGRRDLVLALILGRNPPRQPGINEAFEQLMQLQNINPNEKSAMTEILLCAGAGGEPVAKALVHAAASYFLELVGLLVSYGASVEYDDAIALRKAVSKGKVDLVETMLNGNSSLSPRYASECVELIPKNMRKGAAGSVLDEALIDSSEAGDVESASLLVTPVFFKSRSSSQGHLSRGARKELSDRHEIASTDYKGALALQIAVKKGDTAIAGVILSQRPPSDVALAQRYNIVELFLRAGLSGPCVDAAFSSLIEEQRPPRRDDKLIALLLKYSVDVNFNEGSCITAAVVQEDTRLLESLLANKPTMQTVAKAVPKAMDVRNHALRLHVVNMLLASGAAQGGTQVSTALATAIVAKPTDKQLIKALLQQGNADVNVNAGSALELATQHDDVEVLKLVVGFGRPDEASLDRGFAALGRLPASPVKAEKIKVLVSSSSKSTDAVSSLLIAEVQTLLKADPGERNFASLKALLANGADVNAEKGEALGRAVAASCMQIVELLLISTPNPETLAWVMPHALRIRDSMDRLTFAQKILDCGIESDPANDALVHAVRTYPDDLPLINSLLVRANTAGGQALMEAVKAENQALVDLILAKKNFTVDVLNSSFAEATKANNKRSRSLSCNSLLKAGASGEVVSDALVAAASANDLEFGGILVKNGGSAEHKNGQAIIEACKAGSVGILEMLLGSNNKVSDQILERGFQAATQIRDLKKRAGVFEILLKLGVSGEVVDIQLVSAVRYGDEGKDLVKLLLFHGASPDYSNGEAVEKAARSAFLGGLELLLGITKTGGDQKRPSSHSLVRALDACWELNRDTRFTIVDWIFRAGMPPPSSVQAALQRAVGEEEPEQRLIRLLISNRASAVAGGCQTLVAAAHTLSSSMFDELLDSRVTSEDASLVFSKAFQPNEADSWLCERGLNIATSLLKKGAAGDGVNSVLVTVLRKHVASSEVITNNFADLLLKHGADVNHNHGEVLQLAAVTGNSELLARLLSEKPNTATLTLAFHRVFEANVSEDEVYNNIALFSEHRHGNDQVDVLFAQGSEPVIVRALSQFPRSVKILEAILDVGYYHEQMMTYKVVDEVGEDETITILIWALLQPQKKISTGIINVLIDRGAKVNFETSVTRKTPLMLAIEARRQDVVKLLLLGGAEVDVTDAFGISPLSQASAIGGDLAIAMMSNLLAAGAPKNDGSLHNAARELNLQAMQVLIEYGHDPDFPSPLHGGRTALGELCLHAADSIDMVLSKEKAMERAIEFLLKNDTDITIPSEGKSVLLLALESSRPHATAKVLLRAGFWKYINKSFNHFTDGQCTYSATKYVEKVLQSSEKTELVKLLRSNRAVDVYYANSGPQPEDAVGMPSHIEVEEQDRRARAERLRKQNEDHALAIQRNKELAAVQAQIWANQAEFEEAWKKRAQGAELAALQERARVEEDLFNAALRQQRAKQNADLQHEEKLTSASVTRARAIGDAELSVESQKQTKLLQWEREMGSEKVGNANQISNLRIREREELDKLEKAADARFKMRLKEQKKLVDSQSVLAASLNGAGPAARRQIGFVSGELGPD
ncbi:hypothetical protein GGR57DRAFT_493169 [Xylariaceae sp. FL1272]|nr:hypothetical protein GGR57DRAFT_493169 [Xylariaceae sp. FL1272]